MKYFSELSRIEDSIIRLETMRSLFSVMASGAEESSPDDIRNALWYVEGSLNDIHNELRSDFDALWETVRDEPEEVTKKDKHKGGMKKKKMMTDRELP
jgi:hypothetical protein